MILTDDGEVVSEAAGGRVAEVHPAAVEALVVAPDALQNQSGRLGAGAEERAVAEHFLGRPVARLVGRLSPHVETEKTQSSDLVFSAMKIYL